MKFKNTLPRNQRLKLAKKWLKTYNGQNLVRGYHRYFGVTHLEAVKDLQILGYQFTDTYIKQLKQAENNIINQRKARIVKRKEQELIKEYSYGFYFYDSDVDDSIEINKDHDLPF